MVVVDETQDLSANQVRAVLSAPETRPHHDVHRGCHATNLPASIPLAGDRADQFVRRMVFTLKENHRNTVQIARFAASVVQELPQDEDTVVPDPKACRRHGPRPEVIVGRYSDQLSHMLDRVQPFLAEGDTVAILHPRGGGWFNFTRTTLGRRKLNFCELTRERDWPTGSEQIALSTIHSGKGLEFDHVLLPGLNQEVTPHGAEVGDGTLDSLRRLLAMGIGRARTTVSVGYKPGEQSTLIGFFDPTTYDLVEVG